MFVGKLHGRNTRHRVAVILKQEKALLSEALTFHQFKMNGSVLKHEKQT